MPSALRAASLTGLPAMKSLPPRVRRVCKASTPRFHEGMYSALLERAVLVCVTGPLRALLGPTSMRMSADGSMENNDCSKSTGESMFFTQ